MLPLKMRFEGQTLTGENSSMQECYNLQIVSDQSMARLFQLTAPIYPNISDITTVEKGPLVQYCRHCSFTFTQGLQGPSMTCDNSETLIFTCTGVTILKTTLWKLFKKSFFGVPEYMGVEMYVIRRVDSREITYAGKNPVVNAFNKLPCCPSRADWMEPWYN